MDAGQAGFRRLLPRIERHCSLLIEPRDPAALLARLRELAARILEGQVPDAEMAQVRARLDRLAAKYAGVPESNPQKHEIAGFMTKALEVYGEALWLLEEGARSQDAPLVERAVARAQKAGIILDHLEKMVAEKRELLRLCQEEELQLP